eukprot:944044-Pleurochrysis_carterae.AAC.1
MELEASLVQGLFVLRLHSRFADICETSLQIWPQEEIRRYLQMSQEEIRHKLQDACLRTRARACALARSHASAHSHACAAF